MPEPLSTEGPWLAKHQAYLEEHLEDMPEVRDWTWTAP
jgi:xylulose-5-phosphate/fructose-6-phosphate phosphoketolase